MADLGLLQRQVEELIALVAILGEMMNVEVRLAICARS